jgi:hypothetical protein
MKIGVLTAALAGGLVMFLLGFVFFGFLFADFFRANMVSYPGLAKDPPLVWAIFLFNLAWGWLIAWVVDKTRGGWAEGAKTGAIVMFLLAVGIDLDFHAFMNLYKGLAPMLLHVLIVTFMGMVAGAVSGLVLGYFNKSAAAA